MGTVFVTLGTVADEERAEVARPLPPPAPNLVETYPEMLETVLNINSCARELDPEPK